MLTASGRLPVPILPARHEAWLKPELKPVHTAIPRLIGKKIFFFATLIRLGSGPGRFPAYRMVRMKRGDLAKRLARETRRSNAEAQDQIDALIHRILKDLREGRPVELPGLGPVSLLPAPAKAKPTRIRRKGR